MTSICVHSNNLSGFKETKKVFDYLSDYLFLKKVFVLCSSLLYTAGFNDEQSSLRPCEIRI